MWRPPVGSSSDQTSAMRSAAPRRFAVSRSSRGVCSLAQVGADLRRGSRGRLHVAGGADDDHISAVAPRRSKPEVDDRCALDDGVVADHDADRGVPDGGERCAKSGEPGVPVVGKERRIRAEPLADDAGERGRLLDRLAARERDDGRRPRLAKACLGSVERLSTELSSKPRRRTRTSGARMRSPARTWS